MLPPVVSGAQVVKALGKIGFEQVDIVAVTSSFETRSAEP